MELFLQLVVDSCIIINSEDRIADRVRQGNFEGGAIPSFLIIIFVSLTRLTGISLFCVWNCPTLAIALPYLTHP